MCGFLTQACHFVDHKKIVYISCSLASAKSRNEGLSKIELQLLLSLTTETFYISLVFYRLNEDFGCKLKLQ